MASTAKDNNTNRPDIDLLKCPLCGNTLSHPTTLPCFHSFCLNCIRRYWQKDKCKETGTCFVCQEKCGFQPSNLQINIFLKCLICEQNLESFRSKQLLCEMCTSKSSHHKPSAASFWCSLCKKRCCSKCKEDHHGTRLGQKHSVESLEAELQLNVQDSLTSKRCCRCTQHEEPITSFCFSSSCNISFCQLCQLHHLQHEIKRLSEEDFDINKHLEILISHMCLYAEDIKQLYKRCNDDITEFNSSMAALKSTVVEAGKETKGSTGIVQDLLKKIKKLNADEQQKITQIKENNEKLMKHLRKFEQFQKYLRMLKSKGTTVDIAYEYFNLAQRASQLQQLCQEAHCSVVQLPRYKLQSADENLLGNIVMINQSEVKQPASGATENIETNETQSLNSPGKPILGLAVLDKRVYVVCDQLADIEVYDLDSKESIYHLSDCGLVKPIDVVGCQRNNCLFVLDELQNRVFRIPMSAGEVATNWQVNSYARSLSVTSVGTLLVLFDRTHLVVEFGVDCKAVHQVTLHKDFVNPLHAVCLPSSGQCIISHGNKGSLKHRICMFPYDVSSSSSTLIHGSNAGSSNDKLSVPRHFVVHSSGSVFVADMENKRIVVLDSKLKYLRHISLKGCLPYRLCIDEPHSQLHIVVNEWKSGKMVSGYVIAMDIETELLLKQASLLRSTQTPIQPTFSTVRTAVRGITCVINRLYIVRNHSSDIEVYDINSNELIVNVHVKGLSEPRDLVACNKRSCIYVLDSSLSRDSDVFRIPLPGGKTTRFTVKFVVRSLATTPDGTLLTLGQKTNLLAEFDDRGKLCRQICLHKDIVNPLHVIVLPISKQFIVSYGDTGSQQRRICVVDAENNISPKYTYGSHEGSTTGLLFTPTYLAASSGLIYVADMDNRCIVVLDSTLKQVGDISLKNKQFKPYKLCLDPSGKRLFIAMNEQMDNKMMTTGNVIDYHLSSLQKSGVSDTDEKTGVHGIGNVAANSNAAARVSNRTGTSTTINISPTTAGHPAGVAGGGAGCSTGRVHVDYRPTTLAEPAVILQSPVTSSSMVASGSVPMTRPGSSSIRDGSTSSETTYSQSQLAAPSLTLDVVGRAVCGIAYLDNTMYVIRQNSTCVEVYNGTDGKFAGDLPSNFEHQCALKEARSIVACSQNKCLYILDLDHADSRCRVFKFNLVNLARTGISNCWRFGYKAVSLSLNPAGTLLLLCDVGILREFLADGSEFRQIYLNTELVGALHAGMTPSQQIVVSHCNDSRQHQQKHRICQVGTDIRSPPELIFGAHRGSGSYLLSTPSHFVISSYGFVFVADTDNCRIVVLNPLLKFVQDLPLNDQKLKPVSLCLDEQKIWEDGRLYVAMCDGLTTGYVHCIPLRDLKIVAGVIQQIITNSSSSVSVPASATATPRMITLAGGEPICGIANIENQVFIVRQKSNIIECFDDINNQRKTYLSISDDGRVSFPRDMASCTQTKCIYILDHFRMESRIFRIPRIPGETKSVWKLDFVAKRLSVTYAATLLVLQERGDRLLELCTDGKVFREVYLNQPEPVHAVLLFSQQFLVSYNGITNCRKPYICLCDIDINSRNVLVPKVSYDLENGHTSSPTHFVVSSSGSVFIADTENRRVVELDSALKLRRHISLGVQPYKLCLNESTGQLFVASNELKDGRMTEHVLVLPVVIEGDLRTSATNKKSIAMDMDFTASLPESGLFRLPVGLHNLGNTCYFNSVMQNINQTFLLEELIHQCLQEVNKQMRHSGSTDINHELCVKIQVLHVDPSCSKMLAFHVSTNIGGIFEDFVQQDGSFAEIYFDLPTDCSAFKITFEVSFEEFKDRRKTIGNCTIFGPESVTKCRSERIRSSNILFAVEMTPFPKSVIHALNDFYKCMRSTAEGDSRFGYRPDSLFIKLCQRSSRFRGAQQQDSHEVLRHLMDALKDEQKTSGSKAKSKSDSDSAQLTIVDKVFGGQYITIFFCKKCQNYYHLFEPFLDISLPVLFDAGARSLNMQSSNQPGKKSAGLLTRLTSPTKEDKDMEYNDAINRMKKHLSDKNPADDIKHDIKRGSKHMLESLCFYMTEEQLDEHMCMQCNKGLTEPVMTAGSKQTFIYSPPAILTIHFKRFQQVSPFFGRSHYEKVDDHVGFETELDLAPFCTEFVQRRQEEPTILYHLYGVVVHSGSLRGGHYIAFVRLRGVDVENSMAFLQQKFFNRDHYMKKHEFVKLVRESVGKTSEYLKVKNSADQPENCRWFEISDSRVVETIEKSVLAQKAYLLFYERVL